MQVGAKEERGSNKGVGEQGKAAFVASGERPRENIFDLKTSVEILEGNLESEVTLCRLYMLKTECFGGSVRLA